MTATSTSVPTLAPRTSSSASTAAPTRRFSLLKAGLAAGVVAAVATSLVAALAHAVDIPVAVGGEEIPVLGFAQLTLVGALLGVAIARLCATRSSRPRTTFVGVTVVLTALSMVPDVLADATAATRMVLVLTHVVAAAIVIPTLARRLAR